MNKPSETNWARVDALTDETIDTSAIPPLGVDDFARMTMQLPRQQVAVTLHLDPTVLAWFEAQGEDYEQRINAALRLYAEVHKAYSH
jgi:uncharacterized protein (DUF4415 family)